MAFQTTFVHAKRLLRLEAAVHAQNVSGGEAGFVRQQRHNRIGRLVRVTHSIHWMHSFQGFRVDVFIRA